MVLWYLIIGLSGLERSFLREDVNRDLKKNVRYTEVSAIMCPLHRGFSTAVWLSFHPFQRKISVMRRCPQYRMSAIRRFHCIIKYKTLIKTHQFDLIKRYQSKPLKIIETGLFGFQKTSLIDDDDELFLWYSWPTKGV